ncbi:MAG TPA: MFS transporter [Burkholderiaceae bacterium]|nr:MFS transporter [Burkholderiaceae bacterium]
MPGAAVLDGLQEGPASGEVRASAGRPRLDRWAVAATVAGNALEFYDFLTYSFFAVYIGRAFFPSGSEFVSLLLSLATFGVGFVTRPLGGLLIGAYADRAGRRPALMLAIGLMAVGTLALAATPSYASIGFAAPVILVSARLVQGLALGGEVGASTAVLLECAEPGRRGALASWQSASQGIAIVAAGIAGVGLAAVLTKEQLADWGWRVPFALGLVIVPIGLIIRRRLPETLLERPGTRGEAAVLRLLRRDHRGSLLWAILVIMCFTVTIYVSNYMTTFALTSLALPPSKAMWATLVQGVAIVVAAVLGGRLSDLFGRRPVMIISRVVLMVAIYPAFLFLVAEKTVWALVAVTVLISALTTLGAAPAIVAIAEMFPNAVRSSGLALSYSVSVAAFGGTTQFVIAWLIHVTGDPLSPAYYVIVSSVVSLWAMFRLPETFRIGLAGGLS